jgi:hypothetical protein
MSFEEVGMDFLEHYGVPGMKWGVRRNKQQITRSADAQRHAENAKKHLSELSDKDLKDLHNRLNTERNVRQLQGKGKSFAKTLIEQEAKQFIRNNAKTAIIGVGAAVAAALVTKAIPYNKMNLGI